ncbi:ABC transporter substrate-binding protein [Mycobacterium sp. 21AC1]|uniref:ABC transporter substrate-binding protein n=1 Tax=[Mycobacterium] appelbergii TaxID=2939269 RepID=UPI002938EDAF|nr:ABC transporter substrate-binding protein [Mycobacterium sp. 21AC1]MDV3125979.1 ABC transporter substrate-binding protein [Mycobacterium sp. 21AC1]
MRRRLIAATVSGLMIFALACAGPSTDGTNGSGSGEPQRGGSATIAVADPIDTWNPQLALVQSSYQAIAQVYASLLRTEADGTSIKPGLASEYKYDPAAKMITFILDPAAKFSDGTPVTSADVKFSFGVWHAGDLFGNYFDAVRDVLTPDPRTAVFELSEPDVTLVDILATSNASIYPDNYGGRTADDYWKRPIAAGPFKIDNDVPGQSISLVRNPFYYRAGLPYLDKLDYKIVADQNQQLLQFQSGTIDVVNEVDPTQLAQYPTGTTVSSPSSGTSVLMTQTKTAPLDNADFRRAVTLAIKHDDLIAGGYAGEAKQATSLLSQAVPGVTPCPSCDWSKYDLEKAKELVAKSGYGGENLEVIVATSSPTEVLAAQALEPMLGEAGIKITVSALPLSTVVDRLEKGDYRLGLITVSANAPSPLDPLGMISSTNFLYTDYSVESADVAIQAVRQADRDDQVSAATQAFEKQAYDSVAAIPLAQTNVVYAVSKNLHGFAPAPYRLYTADELWVTK